MDPSGQAWFYGEGPRLPVEPSYDTTLAESSYGLAARWDASRSVAVTKLDFAPSDVENYNSNQKSKSLQQSVHLRVLNVL
jgi:leukotriene-A4 hydrolase